MRYTYVRIFCLLLLCQGCGKESSSSFTSTQAVNLESSSLETPSIESPKKSGEFQNQQTTITSNKKASDKQLYSNPERVLLPNCGNICGADTTNCPSDCVAVAICGNGMVEPGEECDDGNFNPNDGCFECRKFFVQDECADNTY